MKIITLQNTFYIILVLLQSSNNNNVYFKSLSYTNVLFKLEMNAQQNKIF